MTTKTKKTKKAKRSNANQRAAFDAAIANAAPKPRAERPAKAPAAFRDPRMPAPGTILESSPMLGKIVKVEIVGELDADGKFLPGAHIKPRSYRPDGTPFSKMRYRSFSSLCNEARDLIGSNGWWWFGLGEFRDGKLINVRKKEEG